MRLLKRQHAANGAEPMISYAAMAEADPSPPPPPPHPSPQVSPQVDLNETSRPDPEPELESDPRRSSPKSRNLRRIAAMSAECMNRVERKRDRVHRTGSFNKQLSAEAKVHIPESQSARHLAHNQSQDSHDSNPIYEVSSEYMKVQGYAPSFQNLLKSPRRRSEATGLLSVGAGGNDPLTVTRLSNGQLVTCTKDVEITIDSEPQRHYCIDLKRECSKRRLLRGSEDVKREFQQARQRLYIRKRMFFQRAFLCRMSIAMASVGIILMVFDSELCAANLIDKV